MDVEDDLELFEEYDLEHDSEDSRSDGERGGGGRHDEEDDAPQTPAQVEAAIQEVKGTVVEVVSALGGLEDIQVDDDGNIETVYILGDDCLRCLRDLRRLWREGADDPNRVIAHVFSQVGVLQNLLPLLLKTAGGGERAQKISLACVDLLTSITWPVDARAEMRAAKERGEDASQLAHLVSLEQSMVAYKAAVLRSRLGETRADTNRDALSCIMRYILLPSLSKHRSQRSERDVGTIAMSLHLFRNLLAIRDPMATTLSSAEEIAESTLQSDLVVAMARTHILETLLMLANGADKGEFNQWNVVTADCIYAVYGGQRASSILATTSSSSSSSSSTSPQPAPSASSTSLRTYLAAEALQRRTTTTSSRHSRFGTTLSFYTPDGSRRVARTQTALRKSVDELRRENDAKSRRKFRRRTKANEAGAPRIHAEWTKEAKKALQDWADRFLLSNGFQVLTRSVLKDIAMEREKVGDLDEARVKVMLLAAFFLDWFRERRAIDSRQWSFAFLDEWLKEWSFKMVLVRSIDSLESKHWLELSAAVQLWMSLLRIIEDMSRQGDEVAKEAAEHLLANHFYHAETLKVCLSIGRCYTTQSMEFLDTVVSFLNVMPRLLERYAQDKEHLYVRAKKAARAQRKQQDSTTAPHDSDDEADLNHEAHHAATTLYTERKLSFTKFQSHLATRPLVEACIGYLSKWRDFTRPAEQLGNVVAVLHRIAIKAGDVRAFFPAHIRTALAVLDKGEIYTALQPVAPRATEDCKKLVHYCLRRFEKLDADEKALWSSGQKPPKPAKKVKMPREIAAKPGFTRDEAVGIAVGLLAEQGAIARVAWVSSALELAGEERADLVRQVDGPMWKEALRPDCGGDEDALRSAVDEVLLRERPSEDAIGQFEPWALDYGSNADLQRDATTLPALKMLCRLVGLESDEDDEECWKWRVARDALPNELRDDAKLIGKYLERPFELPYGAERYEDLVQAVRRKATRPAAAGVAVRGQQHGEVSDSDSSSSSSAVSSDSDEEDLGGTRKRGHRRRKDLVGDKRKTKGYQRRKPPPASFLNDDVIDSDEEDQVERLWREANGGGASGRAGSSAAASSARGESRSPAARRDRSRSRSGSSSTSSTPPTSSPARRDATSSSTRKAPPPSKRRSSGLFFESDADDSDLDDDDGRPAAAAGSPASRRISPSPSPSRSVSASPLLARKRKAAAAVLSSDDEEEESDDELPPLVLTGRTVQVTQPTGEDGEEEDEGGEEASKVTAAAAAARPARRTLVGSDSDDDDYD